MQAAIPKVDEERRLRWEAQAEWPLTLAALAFLAAYAWPILNPNLEPRWASLSQVVTWGTWALFVGDYIARMLLSSQRRAFVRQHLFDLIVVAVSVLRPLRLLRLVTLLSVLNRHAGSRLRGRVVTYAVGGTVLIVLTAGLAGLDAERHANDANITTYGEAVWWALATITTVGYGDHFPVTLTGRAIATGLMLAGVALLGTITASLASWLVERVTAVTEAEQAATRRDVEALTAQVAALREELMLRSPASGPGGNSVR